MDDRKKSAGKQHTKQPKKDGLQIKTNEESKEDWHRRVGGSNDVRIMSELIGRHPFRNTLPEPPMDPKFLKQSNELLMKQVEYKTTTIESRYKYPILTEPDLGITVNLIDPNAYHFCTEEEELPALHPTDEFLAHLQVDPPGAKKVLSRPKPRVAWLRKTEYLSNDLYEPAKKFKSQMDTMATHREHAKRKDIEAGKTLDERLEDIENSFRMAKEPPTHHATRGLVAKKIIPLVPDFNMWENQYTAINFDDDQYSATGHSQADSQQAVIKAYKQQLEDGAGALKLMGYMLPAKRKREDWTEEEKAEEEAKDSLDYEWVRNYTFNHEMDPDERNLILIENPASGSINFVLLKSRLAVHRMSVGKDSNQFKPSKVDVTKRSFKSYERNARARRKHEGLQVEYESEEEELEPPPVTAEEAAAEEAAAEEAAAEEAVAEEAGNAKESEDGSEAAVDGQEKDGADQQGDAVEKQDSEDKEAEGDGAKAYQDFMNEDSSSDDEFKT